MILIFRNYLCAAFHPLRLVHWSIPFCRIENWDLEKLEEGNGSPLQYSCLENPKDGGAWWATVHGVTESQTRLSVFTLTLHFHALEKEMATHSSVLAWRIPGKAEPGGLPSMGSHRVRHKWSDLAATAAAAVIYPNLAQMLEVLELKTQAVRFQDLCCCHCLLDTFSKLNYQLNRQWNS